MQRRQNLVHGAADHHDALAGAGEVLVRPRQLDACFALRLELCGDTMGGVSIVRCRCCRRAAQFLCRTPGTVRVGVMLLLSERICSSSLT